MKRMQVGRPWVRVKMAMSLDGRTALENGASQWITGTAARNDVQHWRARSEAIMTGVGTVLADDPRLDVRLPSDVPGQQKWQPLRVVLDTQLRTPPSARLFTTGGEVLVLTAPGIHSDAAEAHDAGGLDPEARVAALAERGAQIEILPAPEGRVDLGAVLDRLGELDVNELLVEAGPTLVGEMMRRSLVDEFLIYLAPKLLGPKARPLLDFPDLQELGDAPEFTIVETHQLADDLRLRLRPRTTP
jgi:diaminohydroxyphosphoribosylaminopyrimidine deaminase/5-amino-6-(5-phosphoribosylamino)uracil reductase